jgi:hydantoinase/oxoprolinase-like protein
VTTAGFRDVPIIQRVDKKDPYDLQWQKPRPFVLRERCLEVEERIAADGAVVRPLTAAEIERLCDEVGRGIEASGEGATPAVALSLLFSYANPEHEARLAEALRSRFPELHLSVSHAIAPTWREYERANRWWRPDGLGSADGLRCCSASSTAIAPCSGLRDDHLPGALLLPRQGGALWTDSELHGEETRL